MNNKKQSLFIKFTCAAFLLSLGGPVGFYFHDYLFNSASSVNFLDHIHYIHENHLSTLVYISLGTIFFFTSFGAILGKYVERLIHLEKEKQKEEEHKKNLFQFLLYDIRRQITIIRESLVVLNEGDISINAQREMTQLLDKDLGSFNSVVDTLLNLEDDKLRPIAKTKGQDILKIFNSLSSKHDIIIEKVLNHEESKKHWIKVRPNLLSVMLESFFRFLQEQEITLEAVEVDFLELVISQNNQLFTCLSFKLKDQKVKDSDIPLLVELVKNFDGHYSFNNNTLLIYLPADTQEEKNELNRVA